jgi:predicted regulator of Ras-like GTPase activity (Roadblock/LC7/MglB family)
VLASRSVNPAEAIAELKELSTQIEAVVLAGHDGAVIAALPAGDDAGPIAADARDIVAAAEELRRDLGRERLAQVQVATPEGCVFVVLDERHMVVATTGTDPTVGLVFYDLKTLLRQTADSIGDEEPAV